MRIKLIDIELSLPIEPIIDLNGYDEIWLLVKLHGLPLGQVTLLVLAPRIDPDMIINQIVTYLGWPILEHLLEDALLAQNGYGATHFDFSFDDISPEKSNATKVKSLLASLKHDHEHEPPCIQWRRSKANWFVTVGICTRDGAERIEGCLQALKALDYPNYEILIVDNAPQNNATWQVIERNGGVSDRVRYVVEPRPGLSWARNRVVLEARGDIIALTDDDARPSPFWLLSLVATLQYTGTSLVTGPGYPMELENDIQIYCEKNWGHNGGFMRRMFNLKRPEAPKRMYYTNSIGGAFSLATWRETFDFIGGFDPALGRGSVSGSATDTDLFYRLIHAGYNIIYEPTAMVKLCHPSKLEYVLQHDYLGASGIFAFLTKYFIKEPAYRQDVLKYAFRCFIGWYLWPYLKGLFGKERQMQPVRLASIKGALAGPFRYRQSVKKAKAIAAEYGTVEVPVKVSN